MFTAMKQNGLSMCVKMSTPAAAYGFIRMRILNKNNHDGQQLPSEFTYGTFQKQC